MPGNGERYLGHKAAATTECRIGETLLMPVRQVRHYHATGEWQGHLVTRLALAGFLHNPPPAGLRAGPKVPDTTFSAGQWLSVRNAISA